MQGRTTASGPRAPHGRNGEPISPSVKPVVRPNAPLGQPPTGFAGHCLVDCLLFSNRLLNFGTRLSPWESRPEGKVRRRKCGFPLCSMLQAAPFLVFLLSRSLVERESGGMVARPGLEAFCGGLLCCVRRGCDLLAKAEVEAGTKQWRRVGGAARASQVDTIVNVAAGF